LFLLVHLLPFAFGSETPCTPSHLKWCSDTMTGSSEAVQCLFGHAAELEPECSEFLLTRAVRTVLSPGQICSDAVTKYCPQKNHLSTAMCLAHHMCELEEGTSCRDLLEKMLGACTNSKPKAATKDTNSGRRVFGRAENPMSTFTLPVNGSLCTTKRIHFGSAGDGGYDACDYRPLSKKCVAYSYGIRGDWSWDTSAETYGCDVHGFDPGDSDDTARRYPSANRHFHNTGIGIDGTYGPGTVEFRWPGIGYLSEKNTATWELRYTSTEMHNLGHNKLDFLKLDAEGAEWFVFPDLIDLVEKGRLEQFSGELHFHPELYTLTAVPGGVKIEFHISSQHILTETEDHLKMLEAFYNAGMKPYTLGWNGNSCLEMSWIYVKP